MNQLELLRDMAKAGFTFGKDDDGAYLEHNELYESLNKWTAALWGTKLYYTMNLHASMPNIVLAIDGFEDQHHVWLDEVEPELNIDRVIAGVIHMYVWIP